MSRLTTLVFLAGAALVPRLAAAAEAKPVTLPTRDVDVLYTVTNDQGQQSQQRARFQVSTQRQRMDLMADGHYLITNGRAQTAEVVDPAAKSVMDMKTRPGPMNGGPGDFKRLGTLTIAGLSCTEWELTLPPPSHEPPSQLCLTDDGVLLGIRTGSVQHIKAVKVTYGKTDPTLFDVPASFKHIKPGGD